MAFKDITRAVERMPQLEEAIGISVQGLMATVDTEPFDGEYQLQVQGEVVAKRGIPLGHHLDISINAYNASGQLCGTAPVFISDEDFLGLETLSALVMCRDYPVKVKIVPKKMSY
jgi:hypothetical protein